MGYLEDKILEMINRWENHLCPDCGAPSMLVGGYINKCSENPIEHKLCDDDFYLKNIRDILYKELNIKIH
ncbi:hypothetical protein LCGC14_1629200 [marine sediment metagenome]|uniref:Uncharacterized protein n=1 Tax=marine sediment metagenome TaxID=412755 RepID=A0A0F9I390_9ZZZZ